MNPPDGIALDTVTSRQIIFGEMHLAFRELICAIYSSLHAVQNPPDGIAAGPVTEENFFDWEAAITGPEVR